MDPFTIISMVLSAMLANKGNSGSSSGDTTTQTTTRNPGYQSPMLGLFDMLMGNSLSQNYKRLANFGYPKGSKVDTSYLTSLIDLLNKEGGSLLESYENPAATPAPAAPDYNQANSCVSKCIKEMTNSGTPIYTAIPTCMRKCNPAQA